MATLLNVDAVTYECSCKKWSPLCRLYFCRHCQALRCRNCVSHEVDCHYCPNCLENMPSAEARLKKNKCTNCYDCPSCGHALATRAASLPEESSGVGSTPDGSAGKESSGKKVFYLMCGFCRWSSRESGIPDQNVASGNWPEYENPCAKLLNGVQENFRQMAAIEKAEKERKKYTKRRSQLSYVTVIDKYGLQNLLIKRRLNFGLSDKESDSERKIQESVEPTEDTDSLPDSIFTEDLQLGSVTTIAQRQICPELQAEHSCNLMPLRQPLLVKRSMRCKKCDHNLCKAEFNPSSIKFKLIMAALYHVPEVRLMNPVILVEGKTCSVHLTLCNLSTIQTHVVFLPDMEAVEAGGVQASIPVCEFVLPVKDDTLDLDDPNETDSNCFNDDASVVIYRAGHKIGLQMDVKFDCNENKEAWLSFLIKYDYANLLSVVNTGDTKESPEIVWLQQKVRINLNHKANQ